MRHLVEIGLVVLLLMLIVALGGYCRRVEAPEYGPTQFYPEGW